MTREKFFVKYLWILCLLLGFSACSTPKSSGPKEEAKKETNTAARPKSKEGTVWVVKPDGSKSCGFKKGIPAKQMLAELEAAGVKVLKHKMGHDKKPRMMVCGADTGNQLEVLISEEFLDSALEKGFQPKSGD